MHLLMVEDNETQSLIIKSMLSDNQVSVDVVSNGRDFRRLCSEVRHDAMIIDLTLPDVDGLALIQELRERRSKTPIIVITGRSEMNDKVRCFEAGADDYLVKPFSTVELLLRIRAVTRRSACQDDGKLRIGDLLIDERSGQVTCRDTALKVYPSEVKLLAFMAGRLDNVVTRDDISKLFAKQGKGESVYSVEKLVSRLRTTLEGGDVGLAVRTVRGLGYVLEFSGTRTDSSEQPGLENEQ